LIVRVAAGFFRDLDWQLGERAHSFLETDAPRIVEAVARDWEALFRPFAGRDDYRLWIGPCTHAYSAAVECQTASDGAVELVSIVLDFEGLPEMGED
jgi:hypothetical protein